MSELAMTQQQRASVKSETAAFVNTYCGRPSRVQEVLPTIRAHVNDDDGDSFNSTASTGRVFAIGLPDKSCNPTSRETYCHTVVD